ncbi:MAG: Uma2 family endonuclease [Spirochaetaceae bacterium]|jgi:Uma2 family endonuclease|nr:Uma2 family endonuclease [Spirochaetaceae bacterium]
MSTVYEISRENGSYTYADYLEWETDKRYEIIDGTAYMMSSPTVSHQAISRELLLQLGNFLKGKPCQVFAAPLDVRLFPKDDLSDHTVVQPDLLVVCDGSKLADGKSCRGAPDMVIEIISPSNTSPALLLKFNQYLMAGVREYWLIAPETKEIQAHILGKGEKMTHYISTVYHGVETLDVSILPGLRIDLSSLWGADVSPAVPGATENRQES